jgi:two-component system NtrC family sensor kinase
MNEQTPGTWLRVSKRLSITALVTGTLLNVGLFASLWDQPAMYWILVPLFVLAATGNIFFAIVMPQWLDRERCEDLRALLNFVVHGAIGVVCEWSFASWLFVPFIAALATVPPAKAPWRRLVATIVAVAVLALATGARVVDVIAFCGLGVFLHAMIGAYLELANNLLRERDQADAELRAALQRAHAQERLASIGRLAAEIAHEVNNPMCYVTANTEQLLEDLAAERALSPVLAEHRDVIVHETLDGIRRVNAIVGNIRRFAHGEPEQQVAFDLSEEVEGVLRIARTQLAPDRELRAEIDPGIWIVGLRGQLGQQVLNLIVNAIDALPGPGGVRVRLAVREGMAELVVEDHTQSFDIAA